MVVAVYSCTFFFRVQLYLFKSQLGVFCYCFFKQCDMNALYLLLYRSTNMQSLSLLPCIRNLGILCTSFSLATYKAYCSSIEILNAAVSFAFSFAFLLPKIIFLLHVPFGSTLGFLLYFSLHSLDIFFPV